MTIPSPYRKFNGKSYTSHYLNRLVTKSELEWIQTQGRRMKISVRGVKPVGERHYYVYTWPTIPSHMSELINSYLVANMRRR